MHEAALRRVIRGGLAVTALLTLSVGALAAWAYLFRQTPPPPVGAPATSVTVTAAGCEPAELTVPAGRVTFEIRNRSQRVLEWEILDGVMVVDERENIAPGLSQRLTTRLEPGTFAITCGLLSNPRGRLTVTPSSTAAVTRSASPVALVGAAAEYKVQLVLGADALVASLGQLAGAIATGDRRVAARLAEAQAAYARLRPVTKLLFVDLDTAMDARPEDFADGAADPRFTGFRRLAAELAAGAPATALKPIADRLAADAVTLRTRLEEASIPPARIITGAAVLLADAAGQQRAGARPDPAQLAGYLDAAAAISALLQPVARTAAPDLPRRLESNLAAARAALPGDGAALADSLQALSGDFIALREALDLG